MMKEFAAAALSLGLTAAMGLIDPARAQQRGLELADLGMEIVLSRHAISPDGKWIVVVMQRTDYTDNRYVKTLALVDTASGVVRELTPNRYDVDTPRWSPDGAQLAWLDTAADGRAQIHVAPLDTDPALQRRVTEVPEGVQFFKWSPDGKTFAFLTPDEAEERTGEERFNRSFEAGEDDYLATSTARSSHIWIVPAAGGTPTRVTSGRESVADLEWLRGPGQIAFVSHPTSHVVDSIDQSLKVVDIGTRKARTLVSEGKAILMDNPLRLSPDGNLIAFCRPRGPGRETDFYPENISVVPAAGGERRDATPLIDRDIVAMAWRPDSRGMVVAAPDSTRFGLWHQPLDGAPRRLELGPVATVWEVSMSRDGKLAFIGSESHHPLEIYVMASLGAKPKRLTHFNDRLAAFEQGKVETIRWQLDGFQQDGVLMYPPGFKEGAKAPLVLDIHGGPSQPSSEGWAWGDDGFNRVMAARGWVVFTPNYRGTGSMGLAYQSAVVNDAGEGPGRDVMAGLAAVKARGFVDEERIALTGYSYGGYMTVWLAAHYPGWRVAVAGAPVTDNFDWYNLADYNTTWGLGMSGSPWLNDNAENYWRQSPISYAHKIRTPTLVFAGTHDRRVSITQSYKLYHALKDNGVEVKFIAYPDSPHWPDTPVHERDMYRRWMEWIDRHFR